MSLFNDLAAIDVLYKMDILDMMSDLFEEEQSIMQEEMEKENNKEPKEE
jgi:hypothetical protein